MIITIPPITCHENPVEPPWLPQSKEEAIYLLANGGFPFLSCVRRHTEYYHTVLCNRENILRNEYEIAGGVYPVTPGMKQRMRVAIERCVAEPPEPPRFFDTFDKLGSWIKQCYRVIADGVPPLHIFNEDWIAEFVTIKTHRTHPKCIKWILSSLEHVQLKASTVWNFSVYWNLVHQYLETAFGEAGNHDSIIERSLSHDSLKGQLLASLEERKFFKPTFHDCSLDEYIGRYASRDFNEDVQELHSKLEDETSSLDELRTFITKCMFKQYSGYYPERRNKSLNQEFTFSFQFANDNGTYPAFCNAEEEIIELNNILKSETKHFDQEFFIWFLLAMVDLNIAHKTDAYAPADKITAKRIITRAGSLRRKPYPDPSELARKASGVMKFVRAQNADMPKRGYILTNAQAYQLIVFLKKFPEIRKHFNDIETLKRFINK